MSNVPSYIPGVTIVVRFIMIWMLAALSSRSRAASAENADLESTAEESSLEDTTEDYWAGSGAGPDEEENSNNSSRNETRETLAHEASDHEAVVYVGEGAGAPYVPVSSSKNRPLGPNLQALQTLQSLQALSGAGAAGGGAGASGGGGGGGGGSGTATEEDWRRHPESWDREHRRYRPNTTRVQHIEAECQDDYMKIRIGFNGSFNGLLYSAGYSYDPDCMYVNGTGRDYYEFFIQLNRCGTLGENTHHQDSRKNPTKNLMWNTVTVQYNPLIEEEFDEHFKVTCEYGYDFWKTVTFPFLDVEVATGNPVVFTLQPPECYMEIRYGYGTSGTRVAGPVRVGDPLTLIIYMRSKYADGFDIVVNDCYAHNGGNKRIQLIDQFGCPVDDKLISRFRGSWSESGLFETQVFAYMKTFRFTGSPALYIECDVRMCHGRCPSQPCHWRNAKTVVKRSVSDAIEGPSTPATALSENVNLFQSLRVLQEGEADTEFFQNATTPSRSSTQDPNVDRVCLRPTLVSTVVGLGCALLCIMAGSMLAMCSRMRRVAREKLLSDSISYMTHKGRIN
uniref:ZP domain-containing protein n=1 Tax=Trichogramma kaykai TaxID=54128 RepID=A0ABD2W679_9HYME